MLVGLNHGIALSKARFVLLCIVVLICEYQVKGTGREFVGVHKQNVCIFMFFSVSVLYYIDHYWKTKAFPKKVT